VFGETVTKADTVHPLCFVPTTRAAVTPALEAAMDALPAIKHFRETFDRQNRLISAWLDARAETDYLEGRTLKYVVVIEALVALTTHVDKTIATTVRDSKIMPALPPEAAELLTLQIWKGLNRRSFREKLADVCRLHGITVQPKDVADFSRIRNKIVHSFDYDYAIRLPNKWNIPNHPQSVAQHFFAAEFVDRITLQLFGLGSQLGSPIK
jgi:hypothetical protein